MGPSPRLVPPDQLLDPEADSHHHKLEIEPVWLQPQEEIDAEDYRKRSKPQRVRVAPGPREQPIERVSEQQLRYDQVDRVVHLAPVPPPVQKDSQLGARLHVVLFAEDDVERQAPAAGRREKRGAPCDQSCAGSPEGPAQGWVVLRRREETECDEQQREREREGKRPHGRKLSEPRS